MGIMDSPDGDKSSKRIIGTIVLIAGAVMCLALFVASFFIQIKDPEIAKYCVTTACITGGSLLGIGIADHFASAKGKK